MQEMQTDLKVKGFFRVGIYNPDGSEASLSDWIPNTVTTNGFQHYIVGCLGGIGSSSQIGAMAVGSVSTAPASGDTNLAHEHDRNVVSPTFASPGTLRAIGSWAATEFSGVVGSVALHKTTTGNDMACGAAFATSSKANDQTLSITYEVRFS